MALIWPSPLNDGPLKLWRRASCIAVSFSQPRSAHATKVREALVGSRSGLICSAVKIPVLIHEVLCVGANASAAHVVAHRAEVHVHAILYTIGGHSRRLLLRWAETVCWLWEWALGGRFSYWRDEALANQVLSIVKAWTWLLSLPV